jgi:hypothetical protein
MNKKSDVESGREQVTKPRATDRDEAEREGEEVARKGGR